MVWNFDQEPNVACITCQSVLAGRSVLIVTHYEDDHSWAFGDGQPCDMAEAMVVAMAQVLDIHPDLHDISDLAPGWNATRDRVGEPWIKRQNFFETNS